MPNEHSNATLAEPQVEWRAVVGYEGFYDVSNDGRVRSVDRIVNGPYGSKQFRVGCELIRRLTHHGYRSVRLWRKSKGTHQYIHRLVAAAFIGQFTAGMFTNHLDGDKQNNHVENLEIVTQSENERHAFNNGLKSHRGEKGSKAKLTREQVLFIRGEAKRQGGLSQSQLGRHFGVNRSTIHAVVARKTWTHI